jgi:uncharacterized protein
VSTDYSVALTAAGDETRIAVRLVPRSSRDELAGLQGEAVKLRISAPPVDGRANAAALRLLAGVLRVRTADLRIVAGERSRTKIVGVRGLNPATVAQRLAGPEGASQRRG